MRKAWTVIAPRPRWFVGSRLIEPVPSDLLIRSPLRRQLVTQLSRFGDILKESRQRECAYLTSCCRGRNKSERKRFKSELRRSKSGIRFWTDTLSFGLPIPGASEEAGAERRPTQRPQGWVSHPPRLRALISAWRKSSSPMDASVCRGGNKRGQLRVQKGTGGVTVGIIPWSRG